MFSLKWYMVHPFSAGHHRHLGVAMWVYYELSIDSVQVCLVQFFSHTLENHWTGCNN